MKIKKKNNIGIIVRDFNIGGIQRFVSHLASNLNNEIYNIFIVILVKKEMNGLNMLKSIHKKYIIINPYNKNNILSFFWLKNILNKMDSSISFGLRSDLMVGILSKIFKYNNYFVTERGGRINRVAKGPLRIIMFLLDKYIVSKICTGAISNSELGKDFLIKNGFNVSKIKVIPNGIKISNYERKININKNYTIGYIGRLEEFKNVEVLIKAFNIIRKQNNSIQKLVIAGDGTIKYKLKNITKGIGLKNKIEFIGFTNDLKNYYESIDIGVIPSKSDGTESFPNVLLEHWKYKVPVLLSDIKTIRTITNGMNKAIYFNPDDHNDLAKKIINLVSNKKQMSLMVKEANIYLKNNFDLNIVINQYHDYLKNNIKGFRI